MESDYEQWAAERQVSEDAEAIAETEAQEEAMEEQEQPTKEKVIQLKE